MLSFFLLKISTNVKILVIFSDGKAEHGRGASGNIMDTFRLEKAAKVLRVDNKVKIVGALIPNSDNTQRIQELKGIVTEPNDAIDEDFTSSNLNNIADLLAARVKRFVSCPGNTELYFNLCKLISIK